MFRRLDRRERLVVAAGAAVSALAVLVAFVALPQARRWTDREARITLRAEQLARLRGILAQEEALREALAVLEVQRARLEGRLLSGGTVAVAGSNLQRLLNRYATEAGMGVVRMDAVARTAAEGLLQEIPARVTVTGDIRTLVDLLARIQDGETLLAVDELTVSATVSRRGEPSRLSATIALHGYHAVEPGVDP